MVMATKAALILLLLGGALPVVAQQYSSADWSELRRRIRENQEASSLLRDAVPTTTRAARIVRPEPVIVAKLDPPRLAPSPERTIPPLAPTMPAPLAERKRVVVQLACQNGVPPAIALAIIHRESLFGPTSLRGDAGEIGPGQIMPGTADQYAFDRQRLATDWTYNIVSSTLIMRSLLDQFPPEQAISAYNGGPDYQGSPPAVQEKVRLYTASVLSLKGQYDNVQCE